MKHAALLLLLGLPLLPHTVLADQAPVSACVDALEQLEALKTIAPDLARTRNRVEAQCPAVDLSDIWLVEWIPPPVPPNG